MINAKYLKYLRTEKKLTQFALAVKAGVTPLTISNMERGLNDNPTVNTIKGVALALEIEPEELMRV